MWIDESDKEMADLQGFTIIEPLTVIATHLKEIIYAHAPELLGRQEVKKLLEGIKEQYNVVIDELIPIFCGSARSKFYKIYWMNKFPSMT